jgi:hypothetical protein
MKIIRLPATMSLLQVDKHCANAGLAIVRFLIGREAKKRNGMTTRPERAHSILVKPIS